MIPKPLLEITIDDILSLLENKVPEGSTIEYKSELPHEGESKKIPFLAEVSAFANTTGGDLIFGLSEENGFIKSVDGIKAGNPDKEILRLDNAIRNGIEPRLPSVQIRAVPLAADLFIFVVRVSQSWHAPHRVIFNDHSKFYGRSSAGKYPLDVAQLRAAFLRSEQVSERIHTFRQERTTGLLSERQLPVKLKAGGRLVLHLFPLSSFAGTSVNRIAPRDELSTLFPPLGGGGWNHKVNIDGFLTYSDNRHGTSKAYCQLFRNGVVEGVAVLQPLQVEGSVLPSLWYEQEVLRATQRYLGGLSRFGIEVPVYVALSLVGMKGYRLGVGNGFFSSEGELLDRELILLPEVAIEEYTADIPKALRSAFDMVWNAFGFEQSVNYDEHGRWKGTP